MFELGWAFFALWFTSILILNYIKGGLRVFLVLEAWTTLDTLYLEFPEVGGEVIRYGMPS